MGASTTDLTATTFDQTLEGDGIVFLDFWASWCGPCMRFAPTYEKVAKANPDVVFGKIDTEAEQALAGRFGIRSIPTLMIYRDGVPLFQQAGALPEAALEDLLRQVRALDMDQVRGEMATDQATAPSN